jgi:hypothetical protein
MRGQDRGAGGRGAGGRVDGEGDAAALTGFVDGVLNAAAVVGLVDAWSGPSRWWGAGTA